MDTATDTVIDSDSSTQDETPSTEHSKPTKTGATSAATTSSANTSSASTNGAAAAVEEPADEPAEDSDTPKRGRPRKQQSTARKTRTVELILTVTGTADGDWQAELTHAGKRVVQGLPIAAAAVSRAARELHPDISGGIETVISAAREQHKARMDELQAELDKVKQALAELED